MLETILAIKDKIIIFVVSATLSALISGIYFYGKGESSIKTEVFQEKIKALDRQNAELTDKLETTESTVANLNRQLAKNQTVVKTVTKIVRKEIEKPVYRTTLVPLDGMQSIAELATRLNCTRSAPGSTSCKVSESGSTGDK